MRCPQGHLISISPNAFCRDVRCRKCAQKCPELAREKCDEALKEKNMTRLSEYAGSHTKILVRCSNGHEQWILPGSVVRNSNCNDCLGRTFITAERSLLKKIENRGYKVKGKYVNNYTPVRVICNKGHDTHILPVTFKKGTGCKVCAGQCPEAARKKFFLCAEKSDCQLISEHISDSTKVKMLCPLGHEFYVKPSSFKCGHRCGVCNTGGYDKEKLGFVYFLVSDCFRFIKCGISNCPDKRICSLRETTPFSFTQIACYAFRKGAVAFKVESTIKSLYSNQSAFQHPFKCNRFDGYTEWYSMDDKLLSDMQERCISAGSLVCSF